MKSVCVFCGSSFGANTAYREAACAVGALLAKRQIRLVYGGGRVGLMGALADASLGAGGEVVGVIPRALAEKEVAHNGLKDLHVVESMHQRKALMAEHADAFVCLPGGYGTLEEFCEIVTWCQLGLHRKPCGLLNVASYFDPLIEQFDRAIGEEFIRREHRALFVVESEATTLLDQLTSFVPPRLDKWLDQDET